jgi:hypothetical protein
MSDLRPRSKAVRALLWVLAVVIMFSAAAYQRATGPTYPLRGSATVEGETLAYELIRSETTDRDALVAIPVPPAGYEGVVQYKRYGTDDEYTAIPMAVRGDSLVALLPAQPPAGKLAYSVDLVGAGTEVRIPEGEVVVIRWKDPVPLGVLLSHVAAMFFAMLIGVRAALAALFDPIQTKPLAITALVLMTIGGMILGPVVLKYAFGMYWTGWPFGTDPTDNKTLAMWVAWIVAAGLYLYRPGRMLTLKRGMVIVATVVMLAVYMIPHSIGGTELDYEALESGVSLQEAMGNPGDAD